MVKWSECSPFTQTIRVQILLKSTVFFVKFVFEKIENKQKEAGVGSFKKIKRKINSVSRQEFFKDLMIPANVPENFTTGVIRISTENLSETRKIISKKPENNFGSIIKSDSGNRIGSSSTLPKPEKRSGNPEPGLVKPDQESGNPDFGSLKRRKTLRSASLGSLLQNREGDNQAGLVKPVNPTLSLNPANPLTLSRSETSSPITFTSSVKVQYKTKLPVCEEFTKVTLGLPTCSQFFLKVIFCLRPKAKDSRNH